MSRFCLSSAPKWFCVAVLAIHCSIIMILFFFNFFDRWQLATIAILPSSMLDCHTKLLLLAYLWYYRMCNINMISIFHSLNQSIPAHCGVYILHMLYVAAFIFHQTHDLDIASIMLYSLHYRNPKVESSHRDRNINSYPCLRVILCFSAGCRFDLRAYLVCGRCYECQCVSLVLFLQFISFHYSVFILSCFFFSWFNFIHFLIC